MGTRPLSAISAVVTLLDPGAWTASRRGSSSQAMMPVAIALSMIVLMTTDTPR